MEKITRDDIDALVKVQDLDVHIDSIRAKLEKMPRKLEDLDKKLVDFMESVKHKESELKSLQKKYRALEDESRAQLFRKKNLEEKLMGVKNNREYRSALKEIDDLSVKGSDIEDEMIQCLEDMDQIQDVIAEENARYEGYVKRLEKEKETILRETEAKNEELELRLNERDTVRNWIPAEILNIYTWVQNKVGRVAVVRVVNAVCRGCHLNIPPQMYNELYRCDSLKFCPHCQRIIYWKDGPEETKRSLDHEK